MLNIIAVGPSGTNGLPGFDGTTPQKATPDGVDADCGFWDDNEPSNGVAGARGSDGGTGANGSGGGQGGAFTVEVDEYRGGIEADCRGGVGGTGGTGGRGGNGGQGSDGGWGGDCEANGWGGRGGDGGTGGGGGSGGVGGKGGTFNLYFKKDLSGGNPPVHHVEGGAGGSGGQGGPGGSPGAAGLTGRGKSTSYSHSDFDPGPAPGFAAVGAAGPVGLTGASGPGGSYDFRQIA